MPPVVPSRSIPDIQIVPVKTKLSAPVIAPAVYSETGTATDLSEQRIGEFHQVRSLAPKCQRAYKRFITDSYAQGKIVLIARLLVTSYTKDDWCIS